MADLLEGRANHGGVLLAKARDHAARVVPRDALRHHEHASTLSLPAARYSRHSGPGMMRRMNRSNKGTVKAVSPRAALQTMPFAIN